MAETFIHPTAIVEKGAEFASGVHIGPYCMVGPNVKLGKGTRLQGHVFLGGHTTMGEENEIFAFASVGNIPQDLKYKGEPTTLTFGHKNTIREYATIQPGTVPGGSKTVIGDGNLLMAYTHVAHDCIIGNKNIVSNGVQISGHVIMENEIVIGGLAGIHQFSRLGDMAMIAAGSMVNQDVPPFCLVQGDRAMLRGLNVVGLKRRGFNTEKLSALKKVYRTLFLSGSPTIEQAVEKCRQENLLTHSEISLFVDFVLASKRGVCRPASESDNSGLDA